MNHSPSSMAQGDSLESSPRKRMLTFACGGWVLALTGLMCLVLIAWAVAPAIFRAIHRPPGDGKNIESYGFDLSNLVVPRDLISPATLHRDMVPVLTNPTHSDIATMQKRNDPKYGKYLVSNDRVIGVTINGESRAYPFHVMYVHEIINDELGGVPIAVTYNWLCDSTVVFDRRRLDGPPREFHVSGLVFNSNLLMYEASDQVQLQNIPAAPECLYSQLQAKAISGSLAGMPLAIVQSEVQRWEDWAAQRPQTTVVDRDLRMAQRYKDAAPTPYFQSQTILHPVQPLPDQTDLPAKTPMVAVSVGEARRVYPMPYLIDRARQIPRTSTDPSPPTWLDQLGGVEVRFIFSRNLQMVRVETDSSETPVRVTHAYWFAWHAMNPDDELATRSAPDDSQSN